MQLYAITDRRLFASREALLERVAMWAGSRVDYLQIREKDLDAAELGSLAAEIVRVVRKAGARTRVLLNGPAEVAAASGCDGVHLPSGMAAAAIAGARAAMQALTPDPVISVSCHTVAEIERVRNEGATLALFAPVFEKRMDAASLPESSNPGLSNLRLSLPGQGLAALAEACSVAAPMPVFALGGVTAHNAKDCIAAGAAGVAAIRLFAAVSWVAANWAAVHRP
jgi:thiamine-phosphate pyrophosphorylase